MNKYNQAAHWRESGESDPHAQIRGDFEISDVRDALNMVKTKNVAKAKGGAA